MNRRWVITLGAIFAAIGIVALAWLCLRFWLAVT